MEMGVIAANPVVVVVVIIGILGFAAWWMWWRCTVTVTVAGITSTLTPGAGGVITFTATYASNRGHTFTNAAPFASSVTYSNPSAGSIGVAGPGARPTMAVAVAPAAAGYTGTVTIGPYAAGALFDVSAIATDDNGHSGGVVFRVKG